MENFSILKDQKFFTKRSKVSNELRLNLEERLLKIDGISDYKFFDFRAQRLWGRWSTMIAVLFSRELCVKEKLSTCIDSILEDFSKRNAIIVHLILLEKESVEEREFFDALPD
jgi:hypothetical protein